ncbi:MAG: hypothetical protein ACK5KT_17630 [Dysgonomonas sp.]
MNTMFNIERYWKLEKRNFFLSKMHYVYILGGLTGLYLLSMLMKTLVDFSLSGLVYLAAFVMVVAGPCLFEKSRNKHTSLFEFILPASTFEKFLSFWFKYVIIIPLSIVLLFLLLNAVTGFISVDAIREHANSMSLDHIQGGSKAFFLIFGTQAVFMGGYFYFKRYAFAKTSVLLLIITILFVFMGIMIGFYFFKGQEVAFNFNTDVAKGNSYSMGYELGQSMEILVKNPLIKVMDTIADIVFTVGMWTVCFFKLRETEI